MASGSKWHRMAEAYHGMALLGYRPAAHATRFAANLSPSNKAVHASSNFPQMLENRSFARLLYRTLDDWE